MIARVNTGHCKLYKFLDGCHDPCFNQYQEKEKIQLDILAVSLTHAQSLH